MILFDSTIRSLSENSAKQAIPIEINMKSPTKNLAKKNRSLENKELPIVK
jgi:hypothetical protein